MNCVIHKNVANVEIGTPVTSNNRGEQFNLTDGKQYLVTGFDVDDDNLVIKFIWDVHCYSYIPVRYIEKYKTPHGYAIIVPHGFDTRELIEKWKNYDITLKKDELLFLDMITNK